MISSHLFYNRFYRNSLFNIFAIFISFNQMDLSKTDSQLTDIIEHDGVVDKKSTDDVASTSKAALMTSSTKSNLSAAPRIDISRASSSSQHEDSRDSSPENVFEQVGTGTLQESGGEEIGFAEDGTQDLRSSTEELCFNDRETTKNKNETDGQQV